MAKAVYRKYDCSERIVYSEPDQWSLDDRTGYRYRFVATATDPKGWKEYDSFTVPYNAYKLVPEVGFQGVDRFTGSASKDNFGKACNGKYILSVDGKKVYRVVAGGGGGGSSDMWSYYAKADSKTAIETTIYDRDTYISDVILDYDSVPTDSRAEDGCWYEFVRMVGMSVQAEGAFRDAEGFANEDGIWKPQSLIQVNVGGIFT